MAYPDYSIVIISVTEGGVTTDFTKAFYNDALARKYYKQAVGEGKRAFYYERLKASRFEGTDAQPLVANTEKMLELQPVQTPSTQDNTGVRERVKEAVTAAFTYPIDSAFNLVETVQTGYFFIGEKVYDTYDNLFSKLKVFVGWEYNMWGTEAAVINISNKRVTFRHNGQGGVIIPPTIVKLWPNKDEVEYMPSEAIDTSIDGTVVTLGQKVVKKTWTGIQFAPPQLEDTFTWVPAGFSLLRQNEVEYLSNGAGWYTMRDIPPYEDCEPVGFVYSTLSETPIMYNLSFYYGIDQDVQIGTSYERMVADGECGETQATQQEFVAGGTIVFQDDEWVYKKLEGLESVFRVKRITVQPIMVNIPCGAVQVGTKSFLFDGTGTDQYDYLPQGTFLTYCAPYNYFAVGQGEVYTEEAPPPPPPPPPPDDTECSGEGSNAPEDADQFDEKTMDPPQAIYDENGQLRSSEIDQFTGHWVVTN